MLGVALQDGHHKDEALKILQYQHSGEFEMPSPLSWKIAHVGRNRD